MDDARSGSTTQRTLGYALGGAGLAALGVGAAVGVLALAKSHDVSTMCPADRCDASRYDGAQASLSKARTDAVVADVALGAGAALALAGVALVWTGRGAVRVRGATGSRGGALLLEGTW